MGKSRRRSLRMAWEHGSVDATIKALGSQTRKVPEKGFIPG